MVDRIGPVNAVANVPTYDGRAERQLRDVHQLMDSSLRPLGARTGVRPGTAPSTVTATATQWTCQAFAGEADVETAAEAGAYPFAFDAAATGAMTPADSNNSRIDIVYVQIDDPSEDGSSTPAVTRKYKAGQAGTGVAPAPDVARAFVIAQINVPKAGTGSPSVTWVAPYTAAAGGMVPFNTKADLDLWTPAQIDQRAVVLADMCEYAYAGPTLKWVPVGFTANVQMETTNSIQRQRVQRGVGRVTGNNTNVISKPVTFPVAFSDIPYVALSYIGFRGLGSFNPSGLSTGSAKESQPQGISATGFTASLALPPGDGTWTNVSDFYFSWLAIGPA